MKISYKEFVLYIFAFILTFFVTTKSLLPNMGFSFIAMLWLFINIFLIRNQKYQFSGSSTVLIFICYITFSSLFFIGDKYALPAYIHILGSIILYMVLINLIDNLDTLSKMVLIHVIVVLPIVLNMAYHSIFYWNSLWLSPDFETGDRYGKNTVGMYLAFCFTYLYGYFRRNSSIVVILGLLTIASLALYTISRGTLLSLMICICFYPLISSNRKIYFKTISGLVIIILVAKFVFGFDYLETMLEIKSGVGHLDDDTKAVVQDKFIKVYVEDADGGNYGMGQRASHYITVGRSFFNKPIFGHGIESFRRDQGTLAHNDYLTMVYEYGIVGIILFLLILESHLFGLFRVKKYIDDEFHWLIEAQIVQMFILMFTFLIMTTYASPMTWYNLSLSAAIIKIVDKEKQYIV